MSLKRICIVSSYPLSILRGGLDIQAERTFEEMSLLDTNYKYEFFDWRSKQPADAYHFFGIPPYLWEIIDSIHEEQKPYIVTMLSGGRQTFFNSWSRDRIKRSFGMRSNSKILNNASMVAMITEDERNLLRRTFGIPLEKTVVIPHFVDETFFTTSAEIWQRERGIAPFLLCVGIIQERKNQLLLARVANSVKLPLVLIGGPLVGEKAYAAEVGEEMKQNAKYGGAWIKGLAQTDPLLISAHRACRAFVLLSKAETQPLSVLQAMAAKRPVLLGKSFYTKSAPFSSLPQVNLKSFSEIQASVLQLWEKGEPQPLSDRHRPKCIVNELVKLDRTVLDP
jgi:glycosyltransferase involved in cell wall biosynthesis